MSQPRGAEDGTPRVMHLLESIYGLKQASHKWYKVFHQGARRRRSGGGPGGGCARKPVGISSPPRGGRWKPRSRAKPGTVGG
jgi:hypothetical protein